MKKRLTKTKTEAMTVIMISLLLLMFNVIGLVNGQDATPSTDGATPTSTLTPTETNISLIPNELNHQITAQTAVAGVLLLVTGFIYCFFGRRVYRLTLFILGAYIGSFITFMALLHAQPETGYASDPAASTTIILLVSIAVGFVVGILFVCCASVAIWLLGAVAGYALANFILALADGGVIKSEVGRIIFIAILTTLGLVLTCVFEDTIIILSTSFIGADAIILGIDAFAKTGFYLSVRAFLDRAPYTTNGKIYGMLAGLVGLFIVGSLVQFRYHRKFEFGPHRVKGYDRSVEGGGGVAPATEEKKKAGGYFSLRKS